MSIEQSIPSSDGAGWAEALEEGSVPVAPAANTQAPLQDINRVLDIPVQLTVELGRKKVPIKHVLQLGQGSIVELDTLAGEPMDVLVNGYLVAQGEVVVVNNKFGIRLTDVVTRRNGCAASIGADMNMTQSLITIVVFVALILTLPILAKRFQQRNGGLKGSPLGPMSKVISAMAVGPQQRVLTVEVGPENARTWLVLGVTGQTITCLHTLPALPTLSAMLAKGDDRHA